MRIADVSSCLQFVTNEDVKILRDIEQYYSTQIDEVSFVYLIVIN